MGLVGMPEFKLEWGVCGCTAQNCRACESKRMSQERGTDFLSLFGAGLQCFAASGLRHLHAGAL